MLIATHSGKFHADDVWAVAVLDILFPGSQLIRTRDAARLAEADFAVDVGGVWDAAAGRFDHHQKGFDGARQNGVVYASAGLVWKEYGGRCVAQLAHECCGQELPPQRAQEIAWAIDSDLVQYLDMADTGSAKNAPGGYGLSAVVSGFNPTWIDEQMAGSVEAAEEFRLNQFRRAMGFIREIIINAVKYRVGALLALDQVRQAERLEGGSVLFLGNAALPWSSVVRNEMPEVLFVVSYSMNENRHMIHTVPVAADSFKARKDLPKAWAGLRGGELAAVTGVEDAIFCHNNVFIAAAVSYEGIMRLARLALAEPDPRGA
ncbi:MAG TPA: MYG1 family protein [Noviherbaspirillum sp.]|jgi:uncharacterized UPF0160 family protein|uniref:MYG1 family protein n=1 Tax=Noviherbaspirillum sp. TaxID=1926288 RepID=UPI002F950598